MKRIVHKFDDLSLKNRLVIIAIFCLLIPSILTLILTNNQIKERQIEAAVSQMESSLHVLDKNITNDLEQPLYLSNYIQFNHEIQSILKANIHRRGENRDTPETDALDYIQISKKLENMTNLLNPLYLTIFQHNNLIFSNYPVNRNQLVNEAGFLKWADNNYETNWIGVQPNFVESEQKKNPFIISIVRNIKLTEETDINILISMNEREIRSQFEQSAVYEKQQIMLINAEGTILSHRNEKYIQKQFPYLNQIKNENKGYHIVEFNHADYLLINVPLEYADWSLVSMVPYENAIGNVSTITNQTILWQVFFFFTFLVILILLVNKLTKPVSTLTYVMNQVENENLSIRTGIKGKGDVEQLGASLDNMIDKVVDMIEQIKKEEKGKHKAELEMLQAQINPHFLFNILNSIRLKILLDGDEETGKLIQSLSHLLRMTINRSNEFIPLEKEIETVEHYVKLMNFRRQENIEVIKHIDPNLLAESVPKFILQPVIENAIIHGFEQTSGEVLISAWKEDMHVIIQIKDYGKGIPQKDLENIKQNLLNTNPTDRVNRNKSSFTGIGITNVYQRLLLIYGGMFQMEIESQHLKGTEITFYIPRM